jgi:hypothetical protein
MTSSASAGTNIAATFSLVGLISSGEFLAYLLWYSNFPSEGGVMGHRLHELMLLGAF